MRWRIAPGRYSPYGVMGRSGRANSRSRLSAGRGTGALADSARALFALRVTRNSGRANSRSRLSAGRGSGALADSAGALFALRVTGSSGRANSRSRLSAGRSTGALADSAGALFALRVNGDARVGRIAACGYPPGGVPVRLRIAPGRYSPYGARGSGGAGECVDPPTLAQQLRPHSDRGLPPRPCPARPRGPARAVHGCRMHRQAKESPCRAKSVSTPSK